MLLILETLNGKNNTYFLTVIFKLPDWFRLKRCNLRRIKRFFLSIFMVSLVMLRFRFHFGTRCLQPSVLNLDFTLHFIEGPCCRLVKILLFSGMGMLITVRNQYPVQRRTPLETVRWEVWFRQLGNEIFNSWNVGP